MRSIEQKVKVSDHQMRASSLVLAPASGADAHQSHPPSSRPPPRLFVSHLWKCFRFLAGIHLPRLPPFVDYAPMYPPSQPPRLDHVGGPTLRPAPYYTHYFVMVVCVSSWASHGTNRGTGRSRMKVCACVCPRMRSAVNLRGRRRRTETRFVHRYTQAVLDHQHGRIGEAEEAAAQPPPAATS